MKQFFTLLFVFSLCSARAATYYFSSVSGDDSRTSTQAKSASTPWKSLSKLYAYFGSLRPGDSVLFKRDETFYGSITIGKSGIKGSPIVIGAYGTGDKPVITGLTTLNNWVDVGNGIYESYSPSLGANLNMLLLNDAQQPIGRYPNKGYLKLESHVGTTSITDNELTSTPDWTGAELVTRPRHWLINRAKITSHSGNTLYYSGKNTPVDNYGYFIQNSIKALDLLGEWCYNPTTKKVSMYFGDNSPSSYNIKASAVDYLIHSGDKSYVVFDNLTFKGANAHAVDLHGGSNISVKNCNILYSGINGVYASGIAYFTLENSNVLYSNNDGVNAGGQSTYAVIKNNYIKDSYHIAGMGQSGDGMGAGIRIKKSGLVEYNQVINSGFLGIQFTADSSVIKNNYIDKFCFIKDDGSGIYSVNGPNVTNSGRKVIGNIILNGIGAPEGTNITGSQAEGIYMDVNTNGVEITGNTIANCNRGFYLHGARNIVIKNNTCFNNNSAQFNMTYDGLGGELRNHTVTYNTFFSKLAKQMVSTINTKLDDIASVGQFDYNYYARPIDDKCVISNYTYLYTSSQDRDIFDLAGWKSVYNKDISSKSSAKQIAPYTLNSLTSSNKISIGAFTSSSDVSSVWANSCALSWQNSGVLDGGYLKSVPSAKTSSIVIRVGALSSAKKYILRYSLKGSSAMSISAYLRSSENNAISATIYRPVSTTRRENEMLFTPSLNQTNGSLVFNVDAQSTYYLDNIQLYEAEATVTNPDDSTRFVYNASKVSKTISLDGNYVDVRNNKFSNDITLQPYASAVLIRNDGTQNTPPTVSLTTPVNNSSYTAPATIDMLATATDPDGTISKVQFYNGTTLLHTEYNGTYSYSWTNVPAGTYTITAKATDNQGAVTVSSKVTVSVVAPTVSLRSSNRPSNSINNSDAPASLSFNVFPNPASNTIFISGKGLPQNEDFIISVISENGAVLKTVRSNTSNKAVEVNVSSLSAGVYTIKATTGFITMNKQFVKL